MTEGAPESSEAAVPEGLAPGTLVADRYRVEGRLGEGGMGVVYRAQHVHMRKAVALKVLHTDAGEFPELVARFEREAIAAAHIDHPNVVSATDFGKLPDGSFFLVLEFVDGKNLRDVIAKGPLSPELALHVIREIARALVVAHKSGVVHRDLKPENVMLVEREGGGLDAIKVFDFGIAKIDVGRVTSEKGATLQPITQVGTVFGTPDYMAPEQAMGQPADGRADLYSLGVMLFEMLTGSRPYKGGAVTLMRHHILNEVPALPPAVAETMDPGMGGVLKKLLAKDVAERYADASELVDAIDAITGKVTSAPSAPAPAPTTGTPSTKPPGPSSVAPAARDESTPSMALTPGIATPSGKSWRPVAGAYSAEASKRKRRVGWFIAVGALAAGTAAGLTLWSIKEQPAGGSHAGPQPNVAGSALPLAAELPPTAASSSANATSATPSASVSGTLPSASASATTEGAPPETAASASAPKASAAAQTPRPPTQKGPPSAGHGTKRKTGPGGIYIPPPKEWIK